MAEAPSPSKNQLAQPPSSSRLKLLPSTNEFKPYIDGYSYRFTKNSQNGTQDWTCINEPCKAKLQIFPDGNFVLSGQHFHEEHIVDVTDKHLYYDLKRKVWEYKMQGVTNDQLDTSERSQCSMVPNKSIPSNETMMFHKSSSSSLSLPKKVKNSQPYLDHSYIKH